MSESRPKCPPHCGLLQGEEGVIHALMDMPKEKVGFVIAEVERRRAETEVFRPSLHPCIPASLQAGHIPHTLRLRAIVWVQGPHAGP